MINVTLYDNKNNRLYDISEAVSNISWVTNITEQPGKFTFDLINDNNFPVFEGATISVTDDDIKVFRGYVFTVKKTEDINIKNITAYDALRYLKNKDSFVFEGKTSDQIFSHICNAFLIPYRVVNKSSYICAAKSNDGVSLYEMIQTALDDTLIHAHKWYIIRDNFGVLEHVNVLELWTELIIGDKVGIQSYTYESSIDKDVANQVKLYRDNKTSGKRDIFIVNDTINGGNNLKEWGILQYYESVAEGLNLAQIEERAMGILRLYNKARKTLKLKVFGTFKVSAGSIIRVRLSDIEENVIDRYMLVTDCTHTIKNEEHTMELNTEVIDL